MSTSATVYAPGARPADFRDYIWLLSAGEDVAAVVDGAPPGPEGRLFKVPNDGKAHRVPWEAGRYILDHLGYTGVVRVQETDRKDGSGTDLDLAGAKAESLEKLETEDRRRWSEYVTYVIDDKINNKKVVPPAPEPVKRIMARRGWSLADYNIDTPGQKPVQSADVTALQAQIAALTQKLKDNGLLD